MSSKLLWPKSKRLLPVFISRILMISCLTFRSFIHFEFVFCVWCKKVVQFHFSACCCPLLSAPFAEDCLFFHWILFPAVSKISWPYIYGSISESLFCSIDLCVYVCVCVCVCVCVRTPVPYCLDDYSFVVETKVQDCDASRFGFLFQHYFGYLGSFVVPYKF